MPRDVSGTYTLPTNDSSPAAPRNVIRSSDFNELTGDYASALTDSLSRTGKGKMQADIDMDGNDVLNAANLVETVDIGVSVQAYDAGLASIAGLTTAADRMIYTTAPDAYATTALTPFARTILDDAAASDVYTTLGAVPDPNLALRDLLGEGVNLVNSWRGFTELNTWTATGAAKSNVDGYLKLIASGASTQITLSGLTINGATERYLAIRYRRTVGTPGWDADEDAFGWSTSGHSFTSSFLAKIINTSTAWKTAYLDMWNPFAGGTDWKTNTITGLRFFAANGVGADIDIAWIATAADAPRRGDAQNDLTFAPISFLPNVSSPVARPVIAKIKDGPISLEDCGYVSGNALAALNKALASGNPLLLGPKTYEVDGLADVVTNTPVHIEGYGFGRSILKFIGATAGLRISQNTYANPTIIKDILLTTTQQEPGTALAVTYSSSDSINNRNLPRCNLIDVSVYGHDIFSHGWTKGIVLTDVHRPCIVRPNITGRRNLPAGGLAQYLNMVTGIEIIGTYPPTLTAVPSDILIENPRLDQMSLGIKSSGEVEGLLINTPVIVAVGSGVTADYSTGRPWVKVCGGHMNIFDFGVNLKNAPQSTISDMLIYKFQDATATTYGVSLDACDDSSVTNNTFYNLAADAAVNGQWNAVNIINSTGPKVDNIRHIKPSKTVMLGGTTTGAEVSGLTTRGTYTNATVQLYDDTSSGTNEFSDNNKPIANVTNAALVNLADTTPGAVAQTATLNVNKGERYLVLGNIQATKGGTAGQFLTQLARVVGGGAVATWAATATTITARNDVAASANIGQSVNGVLNITTSGTVVIQLVATVTGSVATVAANASQLSVVRL